jgi:hypothetical protein
MLGGGVGVGVGDGVGGQLGKVVKVIGTVLNWVWPLLPNSVAPGGKFCPNIRTSPTRKSPAWSLGMTGTEPLSFTVEEPFVIVNQKLTNAFGVSSCVRVTIIL